LDLDDENLEAQIENAAAIAEFALEAAYRNRDYSELEDELERAFDEYRWAARTIMGRVDAFRIGCGLRRKK
jgi:hypothetical protein